MPVSGQGFRWRRGLVTPGGSFIRAQFEEGSVSKGEVSDQSRWRKAQVTGGLALGVFGRGVFPHREEEVW